MNGRRSCSRSNTIQQTRVRHDKRLQMTLINAVYVRFVYTSAHRVNWLDWSDSSQFVLRTSNVSNIKPSLWDVLLLLCCSLPVVCLWVFLCPVLYNPLFFIVVVVLFLFIVVLFLFSIPLAKTWPYLFQGKRFFRYRKFLFCSERVQMTFYTYLSKKYFLVRNFVERYRKIVC